MTTNTVSIEIISKMLNEAIVAKDKIRVLTIVKMLSETIRKDPVAVKWFVAPSNLTGIHDLLVEHMDISPKMLMIKNRESNRQRRAFLMVQAMENAIKRAIDG